MELLAQPAKIIPYTLPTDMGNKYNKLIFELFFMASKLKGKKLQAVKLKIKGIIGAIKNMNFADLPAIIGSAKMSLKASAIGCKTPNQPTTSGPLRRCTKAITFLSLSVKKATEIIIGRIVIITSKIVSKASKEKTMGLNNNCFLGDSNSYCYREKIMSCQLDEKS